MGSSLCGCEPRPAILKCVQLRVVDTLDPLVWFAELLTSALFDWWEPHVWLICRSNELIWFNKELQKVRIFLVYQRYKRAQDLWHIRLVDQVWSVLWRWRGQSVPSFSACGGRTIAPPSGYFVWTFRDCVEFLHVNSAFFAVAVPVLSNKFTLVVFLHHISNISLEVMSGVILPRRSVVKLRHHCLPPGSFRIVLLLFRYCVRVFKPIVCKAQPASAFGCGYSSVQHTARMK